MATATILTSTVPADAANTGFGLPGMVDASANTVQRRGVPTTLVLAAGEDDASIMGSGAVGNGEGVTDVANLVKELKGGRDGKELLGTMIKINDIVDGDEEGVVENSFAKQVKLKRSSNQRISNLWVFLYKRGMRVVHLLPREDSMVKEPVGL